MMRSFARPQSNVRATVTDVLPSLGLAYLSGDDKRLWTVTKSTRGAGLQALQPGTRVALTVTHHLNFSVVSQYMALE